MGGNIQTYITRIVTTVRTPLSRNILTLRSENAIQQIFPTTKEIL